MTTKPRWMIPPEQIKSPDDLAPNWLDEWKERASIMEFEGGFPRPEAERLALEDVRLRIIEMRKLLRIR